MRIPVVAVLATLVAIIIISTVDATPTKKNTSDPVCSMLYEEYVKTGGKISADIVNASCDIIAERGWTNGFWEVIIKDFRSVDENRVRPYLRILGKMLEEDAKIRNYDGYEQVGGRKGTDPFMCLPDYVHATIMERAKKYEGVDLELYLIALVRARNENDKAFLKDVFNRNPVRNGYFKIAPPAAQFYAAVALANIGEEAGIEWLIDNMDNSGDSDFTVGSVVPRRASDSRLSNCCLAALQQLAGFSHEKNTKSDFKNWWKDAKKPFRKHEPITLVDIWR